MNRVKKVLITGMAISMASFGTLALAGHHEGKSKGECPHHGGKSMHYGERGMWGSERALERMTSKLELTSEQQGQIQAIFAQAKEESTGLRDKMKNNMKAEREAIEARRSEGELKTLARATADSRVDLMIYRFTVEEKVKAVLSAEQNAKMDELKAKRKADMQKRMDKHHKGTDSDA